MYRRWLWPGFAFPGVLWLVILFVVPFYAVVAIAFGTVDPVLGGPVPLWNPLDWNVGWIVEVLHRLSPGGTFFGVAIRTIAYVAISLALCLLIGYPVAYYIARYAGRLKGVLLVLLIMPLWISYFMRMLAWVNLLSPDGYVNRFLMFTHVLERAARLARGPGFDSHPGPRLRLHPLPDPAPLRSARPDRSSHLEAARDLGASPWSTFWHVTFPLSKLGILGGAVLITLPMFGDYYTPDIVSGAPQTSLIGNQIDLYFHYGGQPTIGAAITVILAVFLTVLMAYYLWTIHRASREARTV